MLDLQQFVGKKIKILTVGSNTSDAFTVQYVRGGFICGKKNDGTIIFYVVNHVTMVIPFVPEEFGGGKPSESTTIAVLD